MKHGTTIKRVRKGVRTQRDRILAVLRGVGNELALTEIQERYEASYGEALEERQARRRLAELAGAALVESTGRSRSTKYRLLVTPPTGAPSTTPETPASETQAVVPHAGAALVEETLGEGVDAGYPPLSAEGTALRDKVRRPLATREPCTNDGSFLEAYQVGVTPYLSPALTEKLQKLGRDPITRQPAGTYARHILERLLVDLSFESSRLEGNRYSYLDTKELLAFGKEPAGGTPKERQMILNHKTAIQFVSDNAANIDINKPTLLAVHAALSENLVDDRRYEGSLRKRPVEISSSTYVPLNNPWEIERLFGEMVSKAGAIADPFEQSFFLLVHIPYLQAFVDVNKRTSRVAANIPLIKNELCPLSFLDVSPAAYAEGLLSVYECRDVALMRDIFEWAYERSCAQYRAVLSSLGEPDPIRQKYRTELRALVRTTVREGRPADRGTLEQWARATASTTEDAVPLFQAAREEFADLRPELAHRYDLRGTAVEEWLGAAK